MTAVSTVTATVANTSGTAAATRSLAQNEYDGWPARKVLFPDRFHVHSMRGLEFHLHQPQKESRNPILTPQHAWEGWRSFWYGGAVLRDPIDGLYKTWYKMLHDGPVGGEWEAPAELFAITV
ncbi:MAG: hypothetical protein HY332_15400 [Chloroflexi bacterium]|nr:hypothetical protein [Chloroflexota bacterium]